MVQDNDSSPIPPAAEGPAEWLPEPDIAATISLSDLPVPDGPVLDGPVLDGPVLDEMEVLFDSGPPPDMPGLEIALAGIPVFDGLSASLETAIPEGEYAKLALIPVKGEMGLANGSPAAALAISQEKYVVFSLAGARYAVPMIQVLEVGELSNFTLVPNVPDWILGVTNLRGDIVSIVDIRALSDLDPEQYLDAHSLLVTQTFEGDITACLVVEQVGGIVNISASQIQMIETAGEDWLSPYVRGVHIQGDGLLSVLNLEGLLRSLDVAH